MCFRSAFFVVAGDFRPIADRESAVESHHAQPNRRTVYLLAELTFTLPRHSVFGKRCYAVVQPHIATACSAWGSAEVFECSTGQCYVEM